MTLTRSAGILAFYGNLWHFGIFAKKSDRKSDPIFPILSDFFPIFRLFLTFRLADSTALVQTVAQKGPFQIEVEQKDGGHGDKWQAVGHNEEIVSRGEKFQCY